MVVLAVAIQLTAGQNLFADGGDFSLDFAAAAPFTYNHLTGGGAYNDGSVGRDKDIVESLEGGDFKCGDIVTFFTQVRVDSGAFGPQNIEINYVFAGSTTGQQGAGYVDVVQATTNCNGQMVENGGGVGKGFYGLDTGCVPDELGGPLSASITAKILPPQFFIKPGSINLLVTVSDLNPGEKAVVRIDGKLGCNGERPTGNVLAMIISASVMDPILSPIHVGSQTIPLKVEGLELPR
jgi:hypothetical protein